MNKRTILTLLGTIGYNVVSQDCRGRFDSEGDFEPYVHEAEDGHAMPVPGTTVNWRPAPMC